jgi:hypothetical protein
MKRSLFYLSQVYSSRPNDFSSRRNGPRDKDGRDGGAPDPLARDESGKP